MSKRKPASAAAHGSGAGQRSTLSWLGALALAAYATAALWPSLAFAPSSLDDASFLQAVVKKPLGSVLGYDHFGHLRPVKNLLFWLVAHDALSLRAVRALVLATFVLSVAAMHWLFAPLGVPRFGLLVAACWALNPAVPSVVAWLSAANQATCLLGILLYLALGSRALDRSDRRGAWLSLGAVLALLFALASYQLAALAPLLLVAYRRCAGARFDMRAIALRRARQRLWTGSALVIGAWLALHLMGDAPALVYRFAHPAWQLSLSSARYLLLNLRAWLWPSGSFGVLFADAPGEHWIGSGLAWLAVLALLAAYLRWGRRDAVLSFGLAWALLFLLPLVNLVPLGVTPVAPHYLYLPAVGLALVLSRLAQRASELAPRSQGTRRAHWLLALPVPLIVGWQPAYWHARALWGDTVELYATTVANHGDNVEARVNLVGAYLDQQRYAEADRLLAGSLERWPDEPGFVRNRFELLDATRRDTEALAFLDAHPLLREHEYQVRRGLILGRLGRREQSIAVLERALAGAPDPQARLLSGYWLAIALGHAGELGRASALLERMLQEFPGRPELTRARKQLFGR